MRRAPWVLGATATGFAAVLSFHSRSVPLTLGSALTTTGKTATSTPVAAGRPAGSTNTGSSATTTTPSPSTSTTAPVTTTTPSTSTSTTTPVTTTPVTTTPASKTTTTTPKPTTTSSSSTTTTTPSSTKSATGPAVNYNYGVLSVTVTARGSKITNVQIASLDDGGNFRSQSIDQQSIPILEQQAIAAQNANIQGVSGATYTSAGFAQSLQGALSTLGL